MSVVAAAGGLWGLERACAAGALYTVAPIRMNPLYWHGLGTTLALVFLPFVVLALGLIFRGARDPRTVGLLGLALVSSAAAHTTTAVAVAFTVAAALALDAVRTLSRWTSRTRELVSADGGDVAPSAPVLAGAAVAAALGAGVVVHLLRQTRNLGDPVSYRSFDPDWLSWRTLDEYLTTEYLVLAGASALFLLLVATVETGCLHSSRCRRSSSRASR